MKRLLLLLPLFFAGSLAFAFWSNREPWATPKGDARIDCAVYKTKSEHLRGLRAIEDHASANALKKARIMRSENKTRKEIREWWNSDDNPLIKASENEDKALAQYQVAAINVTKHLGYSKQRLKEMWEWRINNGKKERESWGKVINPDPWFEKSMNLGEIDFFCKNF